MGRQIFRRILLSGARGCVVLLCFALATVDLAVGEDTQQCRRILGEIESALYIPEERLAGPLNLWIAIQRRYLDLLDRGHSLPLSFDAVVELFEVPYQGGTFGAFAADSLSRVYSGLMRRHAKHRKELADVKERAEKGKERARQIIDWIDAIPRAHDAESDLDRQFIELISLQRAALVIISNLLERQITCLNQHSAFPIRRLSRTSDPAWETIQTLRIVDQALTPRNLYYSLARPGVGGASSVEEDGKIRLTNFVLKRFPEGDPGVRFTPIQQIRSRQKKWESVIRRDAFDERMRSLDEASGASELPFFQSVPILEGLSIADMNVLQQLPLVIVGIVNEPTRADNRLLSPMDFLRHDDAHGENSKLRDKAQLQTETRSEAEIYGDVLKRVLFLSRILRLLDEGRPHHPRRAEAGHITIFMAFHEKTAPVTPEGLIDFLRQEGDRTVEEILRRRVPADLNHTLTEREIREGLSVVSKWAAFGFR